MKKEEFYDLLESIPKAELHVHEEAVLSRETVKKVYKRNFNQDMSDEEFNSLFEYDDLTGFLSSFIKIQSYFTNINDFEYMFKDFEAYLNKNNIIYCETFFSPTSHLKKGWSFHDMISIVQKNIERIKENSGRTVKLIVDVSRSFGVENAMKNLDLVLAEKNPYIVGIGLGGDEKKGPAAEYKDVFVKAKENGLHVVTHAGESCGVFSMKDSLELCKAERLGHGIAAAQDADFMKYLAENKIPLEVCPTSNIFILKEFNGDMKNHPVKKLYDAGVFVTLNTDDPTFFKVSLIDEYWNIYKDQNFSLDEIKEIIKNGYKAAFISKEEKDDYCKNVDSAWDAWFKKHPDSN